MSSIEVLDAVEHRSWEKPSGERIRGLAVSSGVHEGRARLCEGPLDLNRIEPGDGDTGEVMVLS